MKIRAQLWIIPYGILLSLGLIHCSATEVSVPNQSEEHLRERILQAHDHMLKGHFESFVEMRSERERSRMFESEKEKKQLFEQWKTFLSREKPTFELVNLKVNGCRATAEMQGSVLQADGNRRLSTYYDLWLFENGDWFLDDALRTSPEFFPKD